MKVEIYSDIACPWCCIGEQRFERALADFPARDEVEVVFRPFQLDPAAPETAIPERQRLAQKFGRGAEAKLAQVTDAAAGEGIRIDWDRALAVNTRTAHRLSRLAEREYGPAVQRALMHELFAAHFSDGGDVSDHALLTDLAASVGMDGERVRGYLSSGEGTEDLLADFDHARALGVDVVPTFVFDGRYAIQGAHPASTFLEVLQELRRRSTLANPAADG